MTKQKDIQVLIKIPRKWVDFNSPLGMISILVYTNFKRILERKIEEKVLNEIELPEIKIDPAEVKDRMLDILAERALENKHD